EQSELVATIGVYLLDANASVSKCAKLMYVHRNTITYRLQQIASITGFTIGDMPDTMTLYRLAAVIRLVHTASA
ncbi:helix-turn-helix domain-containing protein, partial [Lactiplantibacillus plantarum]